MIILLKVNGSVFSIESPPTETVQYVIKISDLKSFFKCLRAKTALHFLSATLVSLGFD